MNTNSQEPEPNVAVVASAETPPSPEPAPIADAAAVVNSEASTGVSPITPPTTTTSVTAHKAAAEPERVPPKAVQPLELRLSPLGALEVHTDKGWLETAVHRCFPWMEPGKFISLRPSEGEELALVRDLAELPESSRLALAAALKPASFAFQVQRILAIKKDLELRVWVVETDQGLRTFETELDDWPREVAGGALLIQDVCGDLYRIADHTSLDAPSQKMLWAFLN